MNLEDIARKYPNLISNKTSLMFYKDNELLSIEQQKALFERVCHQISGLYPGKKMLIQCARYKFQSIQIDFFKDPDDQVLNNLKEHTDAQYFVRIR